jgi:hypothetical protein
MFMFEDMVFLDGAGVTPRPATWSVVVRPGSRHRPRDDVEALLTHDDLDLRAKTLFRMLKRGITWLNAVNDRFAGLGAII